MKDLTQRKINFLIENGCLPKINLPVIIEILDVRQANYEYTSDKHEDGSFFNNSALAIQMKIKNSEKPFWIVLFKGALRRITDEAFVSAFWECPDLRNPIYEIDGIKQSDENSTITTICNIRDMFDYLWFTEVPSEENEPILYEDCNFLWDVVEELRSLSNIQYSIDKSKDSISIGDIKEVESLLSKMKNIFSESSLKEIEIQGIKGAVLVDEIEVPESVLDLLATTVSPATNELLLCKNNVIEIPLNDFSNETCYGELTFMADYINAAITKGGELLWVKQKEDEIGKYFVYVTHEGHLEKTFFNLSKRKAEEKYVELSLSWYNNERLTSYAEEAGINVSDFGVEEVNDYLGSEDFFDSDDFGVTEVGMIETTS